MVKRLHAYFSGQVQGVGFRYAARSVASGLRISGWVKNLSDGRVEVVAEGEEAELKKFLGSLKGQMSCCRFTESLSWEPPTGEFKGFNVTF